MRTASAAASSLLVAVAACGGDLQGSVVGETEQAAYGGCPTPDRWDAVCRSYEGPTSVATAGCGYEDLFGRCYGVRVSVRAADDQGEWPKTFFVWNAGSVTTKKSCTLMEHAKTDWILMKIPEDRIKCKTLLTFTDGLQKTTYAEHFASNPESRCLGWLECTAPNP